jgi:hypothetical protein
MIPRARGGKKKDCFLGSGSEAYLPPPTRGHDADPACLGFPKDLHACARAILRQQRSRKGLHLRARSSTEKILPVLLLKA